MGVLGSVFFILSMLVSVYSLLCVARIVLSWFPEGMHGRVGSLLVSVTEPWMAPFRRLRFLRGGGMDFSPIAALTVLAVLARAFSLAAVRALTFKLAIGLVVLSAWTIVSFLLTFMAVLVAIRLVAYLARWNSLHPAWRVVDAIINPVLFEIKRFLFRKRIVGYAQGLVVGLAVLAGGWLALRYLFGLLLGLFGLRI
ncbi:MAG TPA: YggT family protein [Spirochaetales bacterium]|nr:YggT family protein [Spirochaetales bacterium]HPE35806.1 YggT family protein [Spirochaetales bacterium]